MTDDELAALDFIIGLAECGALENQSVDNVSDIFGKLLDSLTSQECVRRYAHELTDSGRILRVSYSH